MYKLHLLQHPDWYRTGTSYCYFYIFEIIHHHSVIFSKTYPSFLTVKEGDFRILPSFFTIKEGSTSHPCPLSSGAREETALLGARNRYALRLADQSGLRHGCAGWDRLNTMLFMPYLKTYFI